MGSVVYDVDESNRMVHQYAKFMTLMENVGTSTNITTTAMNSQGSAVQENEKYLGSIEGKINTLKTTFEGLVSSIGGSDLFKGIISFVTDLVQGLNNITSTLGGFGTVLMTLGVGSLIKFTLASRTASLTLKAQAVEMGATSMAGTGLFSAMSNSIKSMIGLSTATEVATASTIGLNLATGALTLGLTLLPMLIGTIIKTDAERIRQLDELATSIKQTSDETSEIDKLIKKKEELLQAEKDNKGNAEKLSTIKSQLHDTEKRLAELLPNATTAYDENNTALATNLDIVKKLNAEKKKEAGIKATAIISGAENTIQEDNKKLEQALKRQQEIVNNRTNGKANVQSVSTGKGNIKIGMNSEEESRELTKLQGVVDKTRKNIETYNNAVAISNATLGTNIQTIGKVSEKTSENSSLTSSNTSTTDGNTTSKVANSNATNQQALSDEELTKVQQNLEKTYDSSINTMAFYAKALKEIETNGHLSANSIKEIAKEHRELAPHLNNVKEMYKKIQGAMKDEEKTAKSTYQSILSFDNNFFNSVKNNNEVLNALKQSGYKIDLDQFRNLEEAKVAISQKSSQAIAENLSKVVGQYSKFFDMQTGLLNQSSVSGYLDARKTIQQASLNVNNPYVLDKTKPIKKINPLNGKIITSYQMKKNTVSDTKKSITDVDPELKKLIDMENKTKAIVDSENKKKKAILDSFQKSLDSSKIDFKGIGDGLTENTKVGKDKSTKDKVNEPKESKGAEYDSLSYALKNQKTAVDALEKSISNLNKAKEDSKKLDTDLGYKNAIKYSKQLQDEYLKEYNLVKGQINTNSTDLRKSSLSTLKSLLGKDVSKSSEAEIDKLISQKFTSRKFSGDEKGEKAQKEYEANLEKAKKALNVISTLNGENVTLMEKLNSIMENKNSEEINTLQIENERYNLSINLKEEQLQYKKEIQQINELEANKGDLEESSLEKTQRELKDAQELRVTYLDIYKSLKDRITYTEEEMSKVSTTSKKYGELKAEATEHTKKLHEYMMLIYGLDKDILEDKKKISEESEKLEKIIYDMVKKRLELKKQKEIDDLEELDRKKKKEYEAELKRIENLKKSSDEYYNSQLKKLDDIENKREQDDKIGKVQRDKSKLEEEKSSLILDTSDEAKTRIKEIDKDILEKQNEIDEILKKANYDRQKDQLQLDKDKREKELDVEKEKAEKDEKDREEKRDATKRDIEKRYEELMRNDKIYAEVRDSLLTNSFKTFEDSTVTLSVALNQYLDTWADGMSVAGQEMKKNLIPNMETLVGLTKELTGGKLSNGGIPNSVSNPLGITGTISSSNSLVGSKSQMQTMWEAQQDFMQAKQDGNKSKIEELQKKWANFNPDFMANSLVNKVNNNKFDDLIKPNGLNNGLNKTIKNEFNFRFDGDIVDKDSFANTIKDKVVSAINTIQYNENSKQGIITDIWS